MLAQRSRTWLLAVLSVAAVALATAGVADPAASQPSRSAVSKVTVTITDRALRVSPINPSSGMTTFVVVNKGKKQHLLSITGPGVKNVHSKKVAGGAAGTVSVTLRPGVYVLSDPVGLGAYTSAFLSVVKSVSMTGKGTDNKVQPELELPPMCGGYI
jgi:hypothetical protein